MTTQPQAAEYDSIGERYSEAKTQPFRIELEAWTIEKLLGSVSGARILDLACGDGFYSRRLARLGAAETLGVDVSSEMIHLGQAAEEKEPLGCRYLHSDVNDLAVETIGEFDMVIAIYLLNYASTREELQNLCNVVRRCLAPGGRAVGVNDFTVDRVTGRRDFERHRFRKVGPNPWIEGRPITYEFLLPEDRSFAITNYYWTPKTYLDALGEAGFRDAGWHPLEISPKGRTDYPAGFFDDFLGSPPIAAWFATN